LKLFQNRFNIFFNFGQQITFNTMKTSTIRSRGLSGIFLAVLVLLTLSACKNQKSSQSGSKDEALTGSLAGKEDVIREISDYPLPTSFEVTTLLVDAGASYILDLCNRVDNVNKYINLKSKALNLGVYGADLSYAATYRQTQETMQYLDASAKLIDELQIGSFDKELVKKVEANIDDVDSLITLISDSFYRTYEYLTNNEQDELSILVMAGSWIEALYITSQISTVSADNSKIVEIINEQSTSLDKLLEIMAPVSESAMSADVFKGLTALQAIYRNAEGDLSGKNLEALIVQTEKLRNQIIS
jgi:hypothetical protein